MFFVEKSGASGDKQIRIRFGQITKGGSHSFKGGYVFAVINFFQSAGYSVNAVGFTFILTEENRCSFELKKIEGEQFLGDFIMYGSERKWDTEKLEDCVGKCVMTQRLWSEFLPRTM